MCVFDDSGPITVGGRSYTVMEFANLPPEEKARLQEEMRRERGDLTQEAQAKRKQFLLTPPPPAPLATIGPRIGVQSVSNVSAGEQGARTTVADLRIGRPE